MANHGSPKPGLGVQIPPLPFFVPLINPSSIHLCRSLRIKRKDFSKMCM